MGSAMYPESPDDDYDEREPEPGDRDEDNDWREGLDDDSLEGDKPEPDDDECGTAALYEQWLGAQVLAGGRWGVVEAVTSDGWLVVDGLGWRAFVRP